MEAIFTAIYKQRGQLRAMKKPVKKPTFNEA
jgi:hypothetical protein